MTQTHNSLGFAGHCHSPGPPSVSPTISMTDHTLCIDSGTEADDSNRPRSSQFLQAPGGTDASSGSGAGGWEDADVLVVGAGGGIVPGRGRLDWCWLCAAHVLRADMEVGRWARCSLRY